MQVALNIRKLRPELAEESRVFSAKLTMFFLQWSLLKSFFIDIPSRSFIFHFCGQDRIERYWDTLLFLLLNPSG